MKGWTFAFYLAGILLVQLGVFPALGFGRLTPQLVLVTVIWLNFYSTQQRAWVAIFSLGLLVDLFSGTPFGSFTLALLVSTLVAQFLIRRILPKPATLWVFGSGLAVCHAVFWAGLFIGQWGLAGLYGELPIAWENIFFRDFFGQIVLTCLAGCILYFFNSRILTGNEQPAGQLQ